METNKLGIDYKCPTCKVFEIKPMGMICSSPEPDSTGVIPGQNED